eukprot:c32132_g1_i1.p2 GENE.c32132_g1_i1~~c32132_g1_i1.p2  ORF type:complete len:301 (+),score=52.84 c32132_g1_i1:36-905(+)
MAAAHGHAAEDPHMTTAAIACAYVKSVVPSTFAPKLAMILGSGCGEVADAIEVIKAIPYGEIPGFPISTVQGHAGVLVCGTLEGMQVVCLKGRVHLYEGHDPIVLRPLVYTMRLLGAELMFSTAAVGSLREDAGPGALVALTDHINFQGKNPLVGPNDPIGPRFPSMLGAYDKKGREALKAAAASLSIPLAEGVYLSCLGPSFETPAEIRAFRILGADVVGMSMVGEVILARHCQLRVVAVAVVVNYAAGMTEDHITHEDTLLYSAQAAGNIASLVKGFIKNHEQWAKE